jgi:dihydrofolate reductase
VTLGRISIAAKCHVGVDLTTSSDCVLLSRKMATDGFINHCEAVALHEAIPQYAFAKPIADMRKVVCSNTLMQAEWRHTEIAGGDAAETVARLKWEPGRDIIVYGGAGLVGSLIHAGLIDEFHLFVNPTVPGHGKSTWSRGTSPMHLKLESCRSYDCGVVVQKYVPIRPAGRTS